MWVVTITKNAGAVWTIWGSDYFPRRVYYKKEAERIARTVRDHGAEATVTKEKKTCVSNSPTA